jgi:hypothetical protein
MSLPKDRSRVNKGTPTGGQFKAERRKPNLAVTDNRFGKYTDEVDVILNTLDSVTEVQLNQLATEWSRAFTANTDEELAERNETRTAMFKAVKTEVGDDLLQVVEYFARRPVKKVIGRAPDYAPGFMASWNAIRDALSATLVQDSLTKQQFSALRKPWDVVMEKEQPTDGRQN